MLGDGFGMPGIPGSPEFNAMRELNYSCNPMERIYDNGLLERPMRFSAFELDCMTYKPNIPYQPYKDWCDVDTAWRPKPVIKIPVFEPEPPWTTLLICPKPEPLVPLFNLYEPKLIDWNLQDLLQNARFEIQSAIDRIRYP